MKVKCSYCGGSVDDNAVNCPHCGAPVDGGSAADSTPKTIAELQKWYRDRNLPPYETTRFFIGQDYREPRAFGIYEENGRFVVYKNKADGSRAVRYHGPDEAYAVNELLTKLKSEILRQKAKPQQAQPQKKTAFWKILLGIVLGILLVIYGFEKHPLLAIGLLALPWAAYLLLGKLNRGDKARGIISKGYWIYALIVLVIMVVLGVRAYRPRYYRYNGSTYCLYNNEYYRYDDGLDDYFYVYPYDVPLEFTDRAEDYAIDASGTQWNDDYNFTDSNYYQENLKSESSGDSDYDWDSSDSWDSGGTDWSSDW